MEPAQADMVLMIHPEIEGGPWGPVTREAFEARFAGNGWTEVTQAEAEVAAVVGEPVADLRKLSRSDLDAVAERLGIDPAEYRNRDLLADAIESATNVADRTDTSEE